MIRKCCGCFAFLFPSLDSSDDDEGSDTEVVQNSHPPRTGNDIEHEIDPFVNSKSTQMITEGSCNPPINNPQTVQKVDNSSQVSLAFSVHKIKHSCKYAKRTPDYKKN
jgi:hypothetical protein